MRLHFLIIIGVLLSVLHLSAEPEAVMPKKHFAFFEAHCLECHNTDTQKGKLDLETLSFEILTIKQAETWQQILNSLTAGDMPPEDEPAPNADAKTEFLADLSNVLVTARKILADTGGVTTMRRLNHREYTNTIRDLLGVSIKADSLPKDTRDGSFDTTGSSLYISSDQIAAYRKHGNEALKLAFDLATKSLETRKIRHEHEASFNKRMAKEVEKQISAQKRWGRWKKLVDAAAGKPENHKIAQEIRKGLRRPQEFYVQWHKIKGAPKPREYGFSDGNDALHYNSQWEWLLPRILEYQSLPHTDKGVYITPDPPASQFVIYGLPGHWPTGEYVFRIHAAVPGERKLISTRTDIELYTSPAPVKHRRFLDIDSRTGQYNISTHQVSGTFDEPVTIEARVFVRADEAPHLFHLKERGALELRPQKLSQKSVREVGIRPDPAIWIDWVEFEGPILSEAQKDRYQQIKNWLQTIEKEDADGIGSVLKEFSTLALRGRTPDPAFLSKLEALYKEYRKDGFVKREALRETLAVVLASPGFLYLSEQGKEGKQSPLLQVELASRLSYFLWSCPPDCELLNLAKTGKLSNPETLRQQTRRLLADTRSQVFVESFLDQWLGLDRIDFFKFNPDKHADFHAVMKRAARREIYETFAYWLREEGRLSNLLKSDTILINALLADLYGIPDVKGDHFRPVKVPMDSPRGGLLGMAAVAAMGSNGDHTSPVERGAWVMRKVMLNPPPPAPPNVPQLSRLGDKVLTTSPHFSRNLKKRGEIGDLSRMVSGENPNQPTISP